MTMLDENTVVSVEETKEQVNTFKEFGKQVVKAGERLTEDSVKMIVVFGAIAGIALAGATAKYLNKEIRETPEKEGILTKVTNAVSKLNPFKKKDSAVVDAEFEEKTEETTEK